MVGLVLNMTISFQHQLEYPGRSRGSEAAAGAGSGGREAGLGAGQGAG